MGKWHNGKFPAEKFDFGRSYFGTHWITNADGSRIHVTQKNENDALEFLRTRPADKPFCLTLAFFATHAEDQNPLQFLPQPQSLALYQEVTVPVPANATDESFHRLPAFIANEQKRRPRALALAFRHAGEIPDHDEELLPPRHRGGHDVRSRAGGTRTGGRPDNTLVIFTGDNGYYHAEHGLADKWYPHQESIRVPLIVRDPRLPAARRGETNDEFALNVDLAPTILAAAGITAPPRMQGRDLAPLYLAVPPPAWRNEFFYEHATIRNTNFIPSSEALVRKDWKYIYWPDFQREQLFDLRADPHEENDLRNDPAQQARLAEMRSRFAELKAAAR